MPKTRRVHRHCGGKVVGYAYCTRCGKWLTGDAVHVIKVGKPSRPSKE